MALHVPPLHARYPSLNDAPRFETTPRLKTTQEGANNIDRNWGCDMSALKNEEHLNFRRQQNARAVAADVEYEVIVRTTSLNDSNEKMIVTSEVLFFRWKEEAYESGRAEDQEPPDIPYKWIDPADLDALAIAYKRDQEDTE